MAEKWFQDVSKDVIGSFTGIWKGVGAVGQGVGQGVGALGQGVGQGVGALGTGLGQGLGQGLGGFLNFLPLLGLGAALLFLVFLLKK